MPNAHLAFVEQGKIVAYLLNPMHPDNGGKAAFFQTLGFEVDRWFELALAGKVAKTVESIQAASMLWRVVSRHRAEDQQWSSAFGLSMADRERPDW